VLRSFNAACDYILVRREPCSRLELPSEVIGAGMNNPRHFLQRRTAFEIFHDVLNDRAELVTWKQAFHIAYDYIVYGTYK
jgi:hypothetical protein